MNLPFFAKKRTALTEKIGWSTSRITGQHHWNLHVVVKACPGSGKTYSVAARLSRLLFDGEFKRKGIAAISFTNVACEEIEKKLYEDFKILTPLGYPHFLGTIDSFINRYIFLPFGHLIMGCIKRPELVGEPFFPWTVKKFEFDYDQYFDKTTFDINGELIRIADPRSFKFIWKYKNRDGSRDGNLKRIYGSKMRLFQRGFANQSDSNFIALKIVKKYPLIANNIANQFEYIIIDEAQDTDEIQMRILEILNKNGANNIMLIGDRDQAIFEWNNAKPELFDSKYQQWGKIKLNENRRSSQNICDFIKHLSSFENMTSVNPEVSQYPFRPEIKGFDWYKKVRGKNEWIISEEESINSFKQILDSFLKLCIDNDIEITKNDVAVLYRGRNNSKFLGLKVDSYNFEKSPWLDNKYHVRDIVRGKHLYENGKFKEGYKLLEKSYLEAINRLLDKIFFSSSQYVKSQIELKGFKPLRHEVFSFIDILPSTKNIELGEWILSCNNILSQNGYKIKLDVEISNSKILIDELYGSDLNIKDVLPYFYGTIHSAKGKTFEAVLIIIGKTAGSSKNYSTILSTSKDLLESKDKEELRILFVGISRPRKILVLATPNEDVAVWKNEFNIK